MKNELKLKAPGMGGLDQVMLAREPRKDRDGAWGSSPSASSWTMDELIFALGDFADLALMNEGELGTRWSDLRIDAGVVGPMVDCALRIVLGAGEEIRVWPATVLDIDARREEPPSEGVIS